MVPRNGTMRMDFIGVQIDVPLILELEERKALLVTSLGFFILGFFYETWGGGHFRILF